MKSFGKAVKTPILIIARIGQVIVLLLFAVVLLISLIDKIVSPSPMERVHTATEDLYAICQQDAEHLYALMLPYADDHDLDWYSVHSSVTPWHKDAYAIIQDLEDTYEEARGSLANNWLTFNNKGLDNWCLNIYVGGLSGYQVYLYYSPYDTLPHTECQRLEGMAYGWSFAAYRNP